MCCKSKGLSRLGVLWGLCALCTLVIAFVSGTWLYTKEPIQLPKSELTTSISFRIGLWRVCPSLKRINSSIHMPSPACSLVKYSTAGGWDDVKATDLGVWTQLDLAPVFIARMRICTVLSGAAVGLLLLGFFFSLLGHCIGDNKTLIASGLYILGALLLGAGLMAFASVLSETVLEAMQYHKEYSSSSSSSSSAFGGGAGMAGGSPAYDYRYGWCFFTAGAAFIMSKMAAVFSLSGYLNRFASVDEMVRVMVPGADRKLREHHRLTSEYMERHQRHRHHLHHHHHHHLNTSTRPHQYDALCGSKEHHHAYEAECGPLLNKTPPDVCTTNKCIDFDVVGVGGSGSIDLDLDCTILPPPPSHMGSLEPCSGGAGLAGQTVPITIKSNHTAPAGSAAEGKYGTLPHAHHHPADLMIVDGRPGAEGRALNYMSKSSTLQHHHHHHPHPQQRPAGGGGVGAATMGRNKKCVKIETFHTVTGEMGAGGGGGGAGSGAGGGFTDFTLRRSQGSTAAAALNYGGSAV